MAGHFLKLFDKSKSVSELRNFDFSGTVLSVWLTEIKK